MAVPNSTTELEAINEMLQAVGATPVSSVSVAADLDVTSALSLLREVSREVQSQGWDFNTDKRYAMTRTPDNEYVIPDNVLSIDTSDQFPDVKATYRNAKLWDQTNHTFTWDKALTFDVVWLFPFTELPETARHYITMKAARKLQARVLGSSSLGRFTDRDESDAETIFKDSEGLEADHNILTGSWATYRVIRRWA